MLLHRTLTRQEVLETIAQLAAQNVPDGVEGDISADFNEYGEIEIYFIPTPDEENLN